MGTLKQNSNSTSLKSTSDLKALMQYVLDKAKKIGASEASVSLNHDSGYSVDVRMGEVDTVEFSEDKGIAVTVFHGKRKGSASSTDMSPTAIDKMINAAYDIAKVSAEDVCFGLAEPSLINNELPELDLNHAWSISTDKAIEVALSCEAQAMQVDGRIKNSDGASLSTFSFHHGYANSNGCEVALRSSRHSISCSLIAEENGRMQREYDYTTARDYKDLLDIQTLAGRVAHKTIQRLGAQKLSTRKVPVVFSSRLSHSIFSSFIAAVSGANLYRKNTFLLDSLGQRIFPEFIEIHEQPHILKGLGSTPIDGEGVPTRNNRLIQHGKLQQYVLGSYAARRLGMETTANSDGVHNLTVDPTTGGLEEILKEMDTGFLVTELMGQGTNFLNGDYSRGASGFWVEGGVVQFPVEEVTIAGNLKNMFRSIVAIGDDCNPNISTRCGSVLIEEMMVAGS